MKKAKYSFRDKGGNLFVNCAECENGGNGSAEVKCTYGWNVKRGSANLGCYKGELRNGLEVK